MQTSIDQTKWYDRIWASLIFFTRLPFWRLHQPPKECYQRVVEHWPLVGWLTGGVMAATLYFSSMVVPYPVAVILAIAARLLLTGALHEDGLADFFDGFGGGGNDRQRILDIMKDSHIGTYGVLGLILYLALLAGCLLSFTPRSAALLILAADPFAKMVASQLILMMPYARKEEEAKAKTVYRKFGAVTGISLAIQGLLPMVAFIWLTTIFLYIALEFTWLKKLLNFLGNIKRCVNAHTLLSTFAIQFFLHSLITKRGIQFSI